MTHLGSQGQVRNNRIASEAVNVPLPLLAGRNRSVFPCHSVFYRVLIGRPLQRQQDCPELGVYSRLFCHSRLFRIVGQFSHPLDATLVRSAGPCQRLARSLRRPPSGRFAAPVWPFPCGDRTLPSARPSSAHVMRKPRRRKEEQTMEKSERQDVYTRITAQIIASLEQGVRPWMKAVERRQRRWQDQPSAPSQRCAVPRHQCFRSVGCGSRTGV
jgi:hypothetical protein